MIRLPVVPIGAEVIGRQHGTGLLSDHTFPQHVVRAWHVDTQLNKGL